MLKRIWCLLAHRRHWEPRHLEVFGRVYKCVRCGEWHVDGRIPGA